jgi:hypothetical protein
LNVDKISENFSDSEDISHEIEKPSLCLNPEDQLTEELSDIKETFEDQEETQFNEGSDDEDQFKKLPKRPRFA